MKSELNKSWYVLYVSVRHEKKVLTKLQEQGVESYLPLVKTTKQWSDRKKTIEEPLFTGYLFVKLQEHELDKPRYVSGVINYLSFGKQKAIVQEREIESLKFLVENGYALNLTEEPIRVGTKVKLLLSAFKNEIAEVHSIQAETAIVYFESLNQYLKVQAPIAALEVVGRK